VKRRVIGNQSISALLSLEEEVAQDPSLAVAT